MLFLIFTKHTCHQTNEIMRAARIFRNFPKNCRFLFHSSFAFVKYGNLLGALQKGEHFLSGPLNFMLKGRKILTGVGNIMNVHCSLTYHHWNL